MAVIITPEPGKAAEIGQQLLELAEHYSDVRWVTWPTAGYFVPEELAVKLKGVRSLPNTEQPDEPVAEPPRRRGRPRRPVETVETVLDTDDTEKEE